MRHFDDVDGVINLSGLSNDPTAEFNPEANWQMNALATETLGRSCVERGIERYVFASSCSLYDGMPPGMHGEDAAIQPRAAYATSKRYGEERLLELAEEGLCPVILRNGTVYGWSPRMRYDLVVNTFVKDALLSGALKLHGGGWMWRPLVDICDCADAMIAAYEAPAEKVHGQIFNVVHSNYQIRELAMIVAGSVQLTGHEVRLTEVPALSLNRNYECANAKLSTTTRIHPAAVGARVGQCAAAEDRPRRSREADRPAELQHSLARAAAQRQADGRHIRVGPMRALITGGAGQLGSDLEALLGDDAHALSHAELDITDSEAVDAVIAALQPDVIFNCAAFHNVDVCEQQPERAWQVNVEAVRRLALRAPYLFTSLPTTCSTGVAKSPTASTICRRRGRSTR